VRCDEPRFGLYCPQQRRRCELVGVYRSPPCSCGEESAALGLNARLALISCSETASTPNWWANIPRAAAPDLNLTYVLVGSFGPEELASDTDD
jgi:hypothetical protein